MTGYRGLLLRYAGDSMLMDGDCTRSLTAQRYLSEITIANARLSMSSNVATRTIRIGSRKSQLALVQTH
ncbi:MAG: hypothetical protein AAFY33_10080, partial [Cyanobacteria bacterium J06643_4]